MSELTWPTHAPIELLHEADAAVELLASTYDGMNGIFGPLGDVYRELWRDLRPQPTCRCRALTGYHDWNCELTPLWAQTIRDLDTNPWTALWMPLSERDFQTMWRRAGRDPITHTRMIEGREHTSWYQPSSGLIFETVAGVNPLPLTGTIERFIEFTSAGTCSCAMTESSMRNCKIHGETAGDS